MKYYTFEIVVEKEAEDDGYMAYSRPCLVATAMGKLSRMQNAISVKPFNSISNPFWNTDSPFRKTKSWSTLKS